MTPSVVTAAGRQESYGDGFVMEVQPARFRDQFSFDADLCESCAREAKRWVETPPESSET